MCEKYFASQERQLMNFVSFHLFTQIPNYLSLIFYPSKPRVSKFECLLTFKISSNLVNALGSLVHLNTDGIFG